MEYARSGTRGQLYRTSGNEGRTLYVLRRAGLSRASPREAIRISLPTASIRSAALSNMTWRRPEGVRFSSPMEAKSGRVFEESSKEDLSVFFWPNDELGNENIGWSLRMADQSLSLSMASRTERGAPGFPRCTDAFWLARPRSPPPNMTSIGTGYDLSASTYSPDGRIFQVHIAHLLCLTVTDHIVQVEYAAKAVENSGSEPNDSFFLMSN